MIRYKHKSRKIPAAEIRVQSERLFGFDYSLRYSHRKTLSVQVRDGRVRVAAPYHVKPREVDDWLASKNEWVKRKLQQQAEQHSSIPQRCYRDGEILPLMDERLTLMVGFSKPRQRSSAERLGDQVYLSLRPDKSRVEEAHNALEAWLKQTALPILSAKTAQLCRELGLPAASVRLRNTRSKWGHCTREGVIQYNWHILLAPEAVVDYLVTHETCHLLHFNHSREYWSLVQQVMPDYEQYRLWLRQNGHTLVV